MAVSLKHLIYQYEFTKSLKQTFVFNIKSNFHWKVFESISKALNLHQSFWDCNYVNYITLKD